MRVGIIDLGTNSVRFDVHEIGKAKVLHREKLMLRLGQGVFLQGHFDVSAVERTVHAFEHFRKIADDLHVKRILAFGTSALREARDREKLLRAVKERAGIQIKVISGEEEAKLIALGILSNETLPKGKFALVDIGGGSTEVCLCTGKKVLTAESFPLGTARLQQVFLKRSPPRPQAVKDLRQHIQNVLAARKSKWTLAPTIMGSSGTARALSKIFARRGGGFSFDDLTGLVDRMSRLTTTELLGIKGMEAKRVDMILAGAVLLEEVAKVLHSKRILPTDYALRDGIIAEERKLAKAHKSSFLELHLDDLIERGVRLGSDRAQLEHVVGLAEAMFDKLKSLHRLESGWKVYLLAAAVLRGVGDVVGYANREKHAFYIVKNSDLPAMEDWEQDLIAHLCLHHGGGKVDKEDLAKVSREKKKRDVFLKLAALLRVVDALDVGPRSTVFLRKVRMRPGQVILTISAKSGAGLEQMHLDRNKKLFEEVYGRRLVLESLKKR